MFVNFLQFSKYALPFCHPRRLYLNAREVSVTFTGSICGPQSQVLHTSLLFYYNVIFGVEFSDKGPLSE